MNHQPFETWILEKSKLTEKDEQSLKSHLETCNHCQKLSQNWKSVEKELSTAPMKEPKPGFSLRFLHSLVERRAGQHHEQVLRFLMICSAGAFLALGILIFSVFTRSSVLDVFISILNTFVGVVVALGKFIQGIINSLQGPVPIILWIVVTTSLTILTFTWGYALWKHIIKGASEK